MNIVNNLKIIYKAVNDLKNDVKIIAVSKTFSLDYIKPLIDFGHLDFGENKVQEAKEKWSQILKINNNLKIHMLGKLQSNKAEDAVNIFSFIHSLDNEKLATKLAASEKNNNKRLKYFIQVNIAEEIQKSGIFLNDFKSFLTFCKSELKLDIIGLMCLPPINVSPIKYFSLIKELTIEHNLPHLSMGMSHDYQKAIRYGSTFIRVGSAIFGNRI
jgi:pyridoxal phosphate enzyme (YggS family)